MVSSVGTQFLIASECMNITSAMRKSPRWSSAGISTILGAPTDSSLNGFSERLAANSQNEEESSLIETHEEESEPENTLILGLTTMRANYIGVDASVISVLAVTRPFLEVIKSPLVSGHITSLALTSLQKFFELGLISPKSPEIEQCLKEVIHALTHCRFEATDRQEDDSVLLQLMDLLEHVVSGECGLLLSNVAVDEIVNTCLSMAMQMKRRDGLRQSVISTLMSLTRAVFSDINNETQEKSAVETLSTFVNLSDPSQLQHTNNLRITIINAIETCFEIGGSVIGSKESFQPTVSLLWKYLAQLIRVTSHPKLLKAALQLVLLIMNAAPQRYKTHFEFVVVYLLTSLTPLNDLPRDETTNDMFYAGVPNRAKSVRSAPVEPGSNILAIPTAAISKTPEIREVMVEALSTMAVSSPSFFPDLFLSYDCDLEYPDLCEDLIGFLCRNAYPDSATWSNASVPPLCLEAVLSGLSSWVRYQNTAPPSADMRARLERKQGKSIETEVAEVFNKSPSKGIAEMVKHKLIKTESPEEVAQFLFRCKKLNKAVLGKYFSKSESKDVLGAYLGHIDFKGQRIDEALRNMLCYFRLPGEAGQIDNLMVKFAERYIESGDKPEKDTEGAHVLAYAVLMLNTDRYSPTVKRKMEYESFNNNVKLVAVDVSEEYTRAIYDGITTQELIMPEEHDTDETFEHSWRENVLNAQHSDPFYVHSDSNTSVVKQVFEINWRPIVSTLSFVFATATDDLVFRRVITGFHQLAVLAARFKCQQALNHIIACLSQISVLTSGDLAFNNSNIEIRIEDHVNVIVSDLSTQVGGDLKAQMASITLFRILNVAASEVSKNALGLIAKALTNLYLYGLYTPQALTDIKPIQPYHSFERSKAGKPVGILSALSSYLTSSPDTPSEPSDESVDAALGAADCIKACHIDDTLAFLIEHSPKTFAEGSLSVLPHNADAKYQPAKDFLLKLAGHAAAKYPALKRVICSEAMQTGLVATALSVAEDDQKPLVMDSIQKVDSETLEVLLGISHPTPSLWRLIGLASPPTTEVFSYIIQHADSASTPESLPHVLKALGDTSDDGLVITALEALAQTSRHSMPQYAEILAVLASLCGSANSETRENALSSLQRELLLEHQKISWAAAANEVIVPHVLEVLVQPKVWKKDPNGMDVTRQQATSIIGKVFLHLTVSVNASETNEDVDAWVSVLKMLDRLLSSRRQPALEESIEEMLKNVILVTKLASRGTQYFWDQTEAELKGFLPDLAVLVSQEPSEAASTGEPVSESPSETNNGSANGPTTEITASEGAAPESAAPESAALESVAPESAPESAAPTENPASTESTIHTDNEKVAAENVVPESATESATVTSGESTSRESREATPTDSTPTSAPSGKKKKSKKSRK